MPTDRLVQQYIVEMDSNDTINNEFSKSKEDIVKYANDQIHHYLF